MLKVAWKNEVAARKYGKIGDPEKVYIELELIRAEHGVITPKHVVKRAEPPENYLHRFFEWNDKKAAQKYREEQARKLINSIVIVKEDPKHEPQTVTPYINVVVSKHRTRGKCAYTHISVVDGESLCKTVEYGLKQIKAYASRLLSVLKTKKQKDPLEYELVKTKFDELIEVLTNLLEHEKAGV